MVVGMKKCTKCGSNGSFYSNKSQPGGLSYWCKQCDKEYARVHYQSYKDRRRISETTREKNKINNKKWRKNNRSKHLEKLRYWRKNNPEKSREYANKRRAIKEASGGVFTIKEWQKLKQFYDFRCLCCGKKEPEIELNIDHVVPLKLGGKNSYENIQPLCRECNSSKATKIIDFRDKPFISPQMDLFLDAK